jgi:hypothetical protein
VYWLLALFVLLILIIMSHGNRASSEPNAGTKTVTGILMRHQYLIAAVATTAVFGATSFFAAPRTALFFGVFIVMYVFDRYRIDLAASAVTRPKVVFGILFLGVIAYNSYRAAGLKNTFEKREQMFSENKGKDVVVPEIPVSKVPFAFTFIDIEPDSGHWVNRCVAYRYQLKSVRTSGN